MQLTAEDRDRIRAKQDKVLRLYAKDTPRNPHIANYTWSPHLLDLVDTIFPDWEAELDYAIKLAEDTDITRGE
jgi:hypothetical protein